MTPEQEAARAELYRKYPEAHDIGRTMFQTQPQGVGSDMANRGKIDRAGQGVNLVADVAAESQSRSNVDPIPQLENDLRGATSVEDRVRIQEEIARLQELRNQEGASEAAAAKRRAATDIASLENELKKVTDPTARRVLEGELQRSRAILGSEPVPTAKAPEVAYKDNSAEVTTLRRFIENPGTNATERGKARMRLAELEGNNSSSRLQRNYAGTAAPAGQSDKKAAMPLERVDVSRPRVAEVTAQSSEFEIPDTPEARDARISEVLAEPNIRHKLQLVQEQDKVEYPAGGENPDRRNFLEKALAEVFGESGLFDKKDLVRFSVLAAGGLLTGGSVGGSLRYAGLDTLKHSDVRRAQEAADARAQATAKAQVQKELRADLRRMDSESIKALDKKAPQVQAQAIDWMNQAKELELAGKYEASRELYRRANMLLTASPDVDKEGVGSGAADSLKNHSPGFHRGRNVIRAFSKDGTKAFISEKGNWREIDPNDFETAEDYRKNMDDLIKSTQQQIEPKLRSILGKGRLQDADAQSKALAHQFAALKHEMGRYVTPAQFGQMAEMTIAAIEPHQLVDGAIAGEALRKSFYLNAVMALRPNDKDLFKDKKTGKINVGAHSEFVDELNKKIADNKASDPNYGIQQASDAFISEYYKLPVVIRQRYEDAADGKIGMTGFLRWMEEERRKKKP